MVSQIFFVGKLQRWEGFFTVTLAPLGSISYFNLVPYYQIDNYVIVKAYSRNITGKATPVYNKKINLEIVIISDKVELWNVEFYTLDWKSFCESFTNILSSSYYIQSSFLVILSKYCCHVWAVAPNCHLDMLDKL